tara:strand:+ start:23318 stop:23590 length:273 start_codon:yes stop_codon:yes gene_type:complete
MTLRELINSCLNQGQFPQVIKYLHATHHSDQPAWKIGELYDSYQTVLADLLESPHPTERVDSEITNKDDLDMNEWLGNILWETTHKEPLE